MVVFVTTIPCNTPERSNAPAPESPRSHVGQNNSVPRACRSATPGEAVQLFAPGWPITTNWSPVLNVCGARRAA